MPALNIFHIALKLNCSQNDLERRAQDGESESVSAVPYFAADTLDKH